LKKLRYQVFVNNRVIELLGSTAISMVIPPIIALYYGTLDIWGDDWGWVKNNKDLHAVIFTVLATLTVIILFLKGIAEACKGNIEKKYNNLVESLLVFFNGLVKKKRERFHHKAKSLRNTSNIFSKITQPKEQLAHVLDGTKHFLISGLNIAPKNIGITIIQGVPSTDKWWYEIKCDSQKQHTKAKLLMNGQSTARHCFETGDSLFIPDIRKGIKEGVFFASERSNKIDIGSVFCKPVRVKVNDIDYVYIFTIAVYGQYLCTPYDEVECSACEKILDEVADRVELELYLHSLKQFKENGGNPP